MIVDQEQLADIVWMVTCDMTCRHNPDFECTIALRGDDAVVMWLFKRSSPDVLQGVIFKTSECLEWSVQDFIDVIKGSGEDCVLGWDGKSRLVEWTGEHSRVERLLPAAESEPFDLEIEVSVT